MHLPTAKRGYFINPYNYCNIISTVFFDWYIHHDHGGNVATTITRCMLDGWFRIHIMNVGYNSGCKKIKILQEALKPFASIV